MFAVQITWRDRPTAKIVVRAWPRIQRRQFRWYPPLLRPSRRRRRWQLPPWKRRKHRHLRPRLLPLPLLLVLCLPAELERFFQPPEHYRSDFGTFRSPLLFADGTQVKTPADWQRRRAER